MNTTTTYQLIRVSDDFILGSFTVDDKKILNYSVSSSSLKDYVTKICKYDLSSLLKIQKFIADYKTYKLRKK